MESKPAEAQLVGDELQHMNNLAKNAEDCLLQMASFLHKKIAPCGAGKERKGRRPVARVYLNNLRVVIDDENGCSVYELPPGICRACKPGE